MVRTPDGAVIFQYGAADPLSSLTIGLAVEGATLTAGTPHANGAHRMGIEPSPITDPLFFMDSQFQTTSGTNPINFHLGEQPGCSPPAECPETPGLPAGLNPLWLTLVPVFGDAGMVPVVGARIGFVGSDGQSAIPIAPVTEPGSLPWVFGGTVGCMVRRRTRSQATGGFGIVIDGSRRPSPCDLRRFVSAHWGKETAIADCK